MQTQIETNIAHFLRTYTDIFYIKKLKTGKEAEVHLLEVDGELRALKIYKQHQKYSSKTEYIQVDRIAAGQVRRAIQNRSKAGKRLLQSLWTEREYYALRKLAGAGAAVPEVFGFTADGILMDYLGTSAAPAPRLVDIALTASAGMNCFTQVLENIMLFLRAGFVHGDLSAYNILWFEEQPWIIDFPQILSIQHNREADQKFTQDVTNMTTYFRKYDPVYVEQETANLLRWYDEMKFYL